MSSQELREAIEECVSEAIHTFHAAESAVVINPITSAATKAILAEFKASLPPEWTANSHLEEFARGNMDGYNTYRNKVIKLLEAE